VSDSTKIVRWTEGTAGIGRALCAIGAFDGVHAGHRFLIGSMVEDAHRRGIASVVVTFDRDPDELFMEPSRVRKLLSNEDRIARLARLGADYVLVLPFTRDFAAHTSEAFLTDYLLPFMDLEGIHVGYDFRLGSGTDGDVSSLRTWGGMHRCDCVGYDLLTMGGEPVTATRIRELLGQGDVAKAAELLGYPFYITGTVVHGRGEGGREFDIPTANVSWDIPYTPVLDGVYAGYVEVDGVRHPAAVNMGVPPTFKDRTDCRLEPHLVDFEGDLYGKTVSVSFVERLRDLRVFSSDEELIETVGANIAWVREHLT